MDPRALTFGKALTFGEAWGAMSLWTGWREDLGVRYGPLIGARTRWRIFNRAPC